MDRAKLAKAYFREGYNCAQAVALSFLDLLNIDKETLLKSVSPLGGGISRLRETCGAVSGMCVVLGLLEGYSSPSLIEEKHRVYKLTQKLCLEFEKRNKSLICRDLLSLNVKHEGPLSSPRNDAFYSSRPCERLIGDAANILQSYLEEKEKK